MESNIHIPVELLLVILTASFLIMEIFNRVVNMFNSKEEVVKAKDAEIQTLRETIANLEAQLAQANNPDLANFLAERGF